MTSDISDVKFRLVLRIIIIIILSRTAVDVYHIFSQDYGNQNYKVQSGKIISIAQKELPRDFWNSQHYAPIVEYEYQYEDKVIFGSNIFMISNKVMMKAGEIALFMSKYNEGDIVDIWVNPNDENASFLVNEYDFSPYFNIMFIIFFFCVAFWFQFKLDDWSERNKFIRAILLNIFIISVGIACYCHYLARDGTSMTLKLGIGMAVYFGIPLFFLFLFTRDRY